MPKFSKNRFLGCDFAKYETILDKDIAKYAGKKISFFYAYKYYKNKHALLLLDVAKDDESWGAFISGVSMNNNKSGMGKMNVEKVKIGKTTYYRLFVKSIDGYDTKEGVATVLEKTLFEDNLNIEALLLGAIPKKPSQEEAPEIEESIEVKEEPNDMPKDLNAFKKEMKERFEKVKKFTTETKKDLIEIEQLENRFSGLQRVEDSDLSLLYKKNEALADKLTKAKKVLQTWLDKIEPHPKFFAKVIKSTHEEIKAFNKSLMECTEKEVYLEDVLNLYDELGELKIEELKVMGGKAPLKEKLTDITYLLDECRKIMAILNDADGDFDAKVAKKVTKITLAPIMGSLADAYGVLDDIGTKLRGYNDEAEAIKTILEKYKSHDVNIPFTEMDYFSARSLTSRAKKFNTELLLWSENEGSLYNEGEVVYKKSRILLENAISWEKNVVSKVYGTNPIVISPNAYKIVLGNIENNFNRAITVNYLVDNSVNRFERILADLKAQIDEVVAVYDENSNDPTLRERVLNLSRDIREQIVKELPRLKDKAATEARIILDYSNYYTNAKHRLDHMNKEMAPSRIASQLPNFTNLYMATVEKSKKWDAASPSLHNNLKVQLTIDFEALVQQITNTLVTLKEMSIILNKLASNTKTGSSRDALKIVRFSAKFAVYKEEELEEMATPLGKETLAFIKKWESKYKKPQSDPPAYEIIGKLKKTIEEYLAITEPDLEKLKGKKILTIPELGPPGSEMFEGFRKYCDTSFNTEYAGFISLVHSVNWEADVRNGYPIYLKVYELYLDETARYQINMSYVAQQKLRTINAKIQKESASGRELAKLIRYLKDDGGLAIQGSLKDIILRFRMSKFYPKGYKI